jgi:hypothetical protein
MGAKYSARFSLATVATQIEPSLVQSLDLGCISSLSFSRALLLAPERMGGLNHCSTQDIRNSIVLNRL